MSMSGGLSSGVPIVKGSPSIGLPYTLAASHWLKKKKEIQARYNKAYMQFVFVCVYCNEIIDQT